MERRGIVRDEADRAAVVARLAASVTGAGFTVYAWALLPAHAHLLVRTGPRPLSQVMRALRTGYASACNRRHHRVGPRFQNRDKSLGVEAEPYRLSLTRDLHLNPRRAGVHTTPTALARYPGTGRSALVATVPRPWQATDPLLRQCGRPARAHATWRHRTPVTAGGTSAHRSRFRRSD